MVDPLSPLYRLYERRLLREVQRGPMPRHIGLILDGNRRYARELGLQDLLAGHRIGADKLEEVLDWLEELQIRITTLFALSTQNLARAPAELTFAGMKSYRKGIPVYLGDIGKDDSEGKRGCLWPG